MKEDHSHACPRTAALLADVFPFRDYSFQEHFENRTGRFILTNVICHDRKTAVCINIENGTSAAWRDSASVKPFSLDLSSPPFETTAETACLSYDFANFLGTHFDVIRRRLPKAAFNSANRASLGRISRSSSDMTDTLSGMQSCYGDVLRIWESLNRSIDTPIYKMRKIKKPLQLMNGSAPSTDGLQLLQAFSDSVMIYDKLPELTIFGTDNKTRGREMPNKRDAKLRYFMQKNRINPLQGTNQLNFVAHELKPLNIAKCLRWNCTGNPRTDSIDLLMSHNMCPLLTEVKMAGDSFVSVAIVQLLYYAAVLASANQKGRIRRYFPQIGEGQMRLAVIAQKRDESKRKERGFDEDRRSVLRFLGLQETAEVLGKHFGGAFVLVVEEVGDSFRIADDQETFIDWSKR